MMSTARGRSRRRLPGLILLLLLVAEGAAGAHDFWIAPATFAPQRHQAVDVGLFVGDQGEARPVLRSPDRIVRFDAVQTGGVRAIAGFARQAPAGVYRPDVSGAVTLVYQSMPERIVLPARKFEDYLAEEGLEDILSERRRRGESAEPGREGYARSCKAMLDVVGTDAGARAPGAVGLPLELIPDRDPSSVRVPERLAFTLEFEGTPLAGRLVELMDLDDPTLRFAGRTNRHGRVVFAAPGPGRWMAATVHMRRAVPGLAIDWESFWGTLTFEVPEAPIRSAAR